MPSRFSDSPDDLPPDSLKYNTYRITSDTTMYNVNCQSVFLDRGATVIVIDKDGSGVCDGLSLSLSLSPSFPLSLFPSLSLSFSLSFSCISIMHDTPTCLHVHVLI